MIEWTAAAYFIRGNYSYRTGFDGFVFKLKHRGGCNALPIVKKFRSKNLIDEATSVSRKYKSKRFEV